MKKNDINLFLSLTFTIRKASVRLKAFFLCVCVCRVHISFPPSLLAIVYFMTCWIRGCVYALELRNTYLNYLDGEYA